MTRMIRETVSANNTLEDLAVLVHTAFTNGIPAEAVIVEVDVESGDYGYNAETRIRDVYWGGNFSATFEWPAPKEDL